MSPSRAERTPRFAVYLRISKDPDGTQDATARQLKDCKAFARARGFKIVETFEDVDLSAYRKGVRRPGYEAMLAGIAAGNFDGVLVWRLDRLVRRTVEFSRFWQIAEAAQVQLVAATQSIDTSDPIGMLIVHVLVAFAEMESATTSARLRAKETHQALEGMHKSRGRKVYGLNVGWKTINQREAGVVRELADRIVAGESFASIVTDLNARGTVAPGGGPWSVSGLKALMRSPRLWGKREHHGEVVAAGDWPPILDEITGMRVRQLIDRRRGTGPGNGRRHLLSGILRCKKCGARMKAGTGSGGRLKYRCPTKVEGGCNGTSILADPTDEAVTEMVLSSIDTTALATARRARRTNRRGDAELLAELLEIGRRNEELAAMWAAGELNRSAWSTAARQLEARGEEISSELATSRAADPLGLITGRGGVRAAWDGMPLARRRAVIEAVVDRVIVHGADSEYFMDRLRVSLLEEADEYRAAGDERSAKRRERQAEARTGGGGSFRPERLEPIWRV